MSHMPPRWAIPSPGRSSRLLSFVPDFLHHQTVREIFPPFPELYYSILFSVPKKDGTLRPIIDLSSLNQLIKIPKFKMETIQRISATITAPMWGCTADVSNAFHSVPLNWEFHKYFAFCLRDKGRLRVFVFQFLPFGLSIAPWVFNRVIRPIKRHIRINICRFHSYLDDFFILDYSPEALLAKIPRIRALITSLGLNWNEDKSDFRPRLVVQFLGVKIDLHHLTLSLPEDKIAKCLEFCYSFRTSPTTSRRHMECLIGFLSFISSYITRGRFFLLPLIVRMLRISSPSSRDLSLPQDPKFLKYLSIWENIDFLSSSVPMHLPEPQLEIMTDASGQGWSGILLPETVWGHWEDWQKPLHSNWKELKAIYLTLLHFRRSICGKAIRLYSDNTTALNCLRKQGSLYNLSLHQLTGEILELCAKFSISLIPRHIQGTLNVLADRGSRRGPISTEWTLDDDSFYLVTSFLSLFPQVDLFATRYNFKIDPFVSPCPDEMAWAMDALTVDWNSWDSIYLFPPKPLLTSLLPKIASFKGQGLLIAERLPGSLLTTSLDHLCRSYWKIPAPVLSQETDVGLAFHSCPESLRLHAWYL